jgi:Flp pilus assembly protein TadG
VVRRTSTARRGERGAALVEAAIVTPVFFLILFGIVEFSLAFHDQLTEANMGRAGARAGSTHGKDLLADYELVQAVNKAAGSLPRRNIAYIVVYKAAAPTDRVPAGCAGGTAQE